MSTPAVKEPASAGTAHGFGIKALLKAFRFVTRRLAAAKTARRARAVRIRVVLLAVVAAQREEVADER